MSLKNKALYDPNPGLLGRRNRLTVIRFHSFALISLILLFVGMSPSALAQDESWLEDYFEVALDPVKQFGPFDDRSGIAISPDGDRVAVASDGTIRLLSVSDKLPEQLVRTKERARTDIVFDPQGRYVAFNGEYEGIGIAAVSDLDEVAYFGGRLSWSSPSPRVSPRGDLIAISDHLANRIELRSLPDGKLLRSLPHAPGMAQIYAMEFSPSGDSLYTVEEYGTIRVWDITEARTGEELADVSDSGPGGYLHELAVFPDGSRLAVAAAKEPDIRIYASDTGRLIGRIRSHASDVTAIAFSPDGKLLASADRGNALRLSDALTGETLQSLSVDSAFIGQLAFSARGDRLAARLIFPDSDHETRVHVWGVSQQQMATEDAAFVHCEPGPKARFEGREYLGQRDRTAPPRENALSSFARAWESGDVKLIDAYFRAGIASQQEEYAGNLLQWAARKGWPELAKIALSCGIDIEETMTYAGYDETEGVTALHLAAQFRHAPMVQLLLERGATPNPADANGATPLHSAALYGDPAMVENLIANGATVAARTNGGNTPLHYAALEGNFGIVEVLSRNGAGLDDENASGTRPLEYAVEKGHLPVIRFLADRGAKLDYRDNKDRAPLHHAVDRGNGDLVRYLLEKGMDVNATDEKGRTPLHYAVADSREEIAVQLLKWGASLDAADSAGNTALHVAAEEKDPELVQLLLRQGAPLSATNNAGETPLIAALKNRAMTSASHLLDADVDVDVRDQSGQTALTVAVAYYEEAAKRYREGHWSNRKMLVWKAMVERIQSKSR